MNGEPETRSVGEDLVARNTVLSAIRDGMLLFDPSGTLTYANRAARSLLGRRFNTDTSASPLLLHGSILDVRDQVVDGAIGAPATRQFETPDAVVEATAFQAEPPGSVVVSLRDVTGVTAVERLRRDFVANASHELKTPVASILALSDVLREASRHDPEAMTHLLFRLSQETARLATLVRDLLELSRLEAGPLPRSMVSFNVVVEAEMERLRKRAESEGLLWSLTAKTEPVVVSGSEADLILLVNNLLDNAIRYTPNGGEVRVALQSDDGEVALTVADTGVGIPAPDLGRVFERFYRVDAARSRQTGGTGLGLSIVRNVAEAHGGSVYLTSELGAGSTFTVRLPLRQERGRAMTAGRGSDSPDPAP